MVVFPRLVVVSNLTTIMAVFDARWQNESCTLFWATCPCPFLEWSSMLYVHPIEATMAMSSIQNMSIYSDYWWMLQRWLPSFFTT